MVAVRGGRQLKSSCGSPRYAGVAKADQGFRKATRDERDRGQVASDERANGVDEGLAVRGSWGDEDPDNVTGD